MRLLTKVLSACLLTVGCLGFGLGSAKADIWGSYAWVQGDDRFPEICLNTGVDILTSSNPDKHNVDASNACATNYTVEAQVAEYNANNVLQALNENLNVTNYAQAHVQNATPSGYYWVWTSGIKISGNYVEQSCSNRGFPYADCFNG